MSPEIKKNYRFCINYVISCFLLILPFNMCISLLMNNLFWPDKSTSYLYFSQVSLSTPSLLEVYLSRKLDNDCWTSWECILYLDILVWNTVRQHYSSILISLLDTRVLTLFVTESLASNVEKYSFNLHIATHFYTVICFLKFILKQKSYWIEIFLVGILSRLNCVNFRASTKWLIR